MNFDLSAATELLKSLSLKKVAQVLVLSIMLLTAWFVYRFKDDVYASMQPRQSINDATTAEIKLTHRTIEKLDEIVMKSPDLIVGIQIMSVDFRRNIRMSPHLSTLSPVLRKAVREHQDNKFAESPLFIDDAANDRRIVDLLNGVFSCVPFEVSYSAKIYPSAKGTVDTLCSIGIPPYYGKFSGYINIFLKRPPTEDELVMIKNMARDISNSIYINDVEHIKQPRDSQQLY